MTNLLWCLYCFASLIKIYISSKIYILARPAVFRGHLRAFGKCTAGVARLKGIQNLDSMRLTVGEKRNFTPALTCSNLSKPFHTCWNLFTTVHTWSHLVTPITPVQIFSHLFTLVHTCSHLFTPVHTFSHHSDYLRSSPITVSRGILPSRKLLFFNLTCYLVEIAYFCSCT